MAYFIADSAKWGCKWLDEAIRYDYCMQSTDIPHSTLNTLRPRQNARRSADKTFKRNVWISIEIPLKLVPKGLNSNIPALVKIMACRWPGDKPLPEPMMVRLPMHICVSRTQWVKRLGRILFFSCGKQLYNCLGICPSVCLSICMSHVVSLPWLHASLTDSLHIWHKYNQWGNNVLFTAFWSKGYGHTGHSYLKCCPLVDKGCCIY